MSHHARMTEAHLHTTTAELRGGVVEYRFDRRTGPAVVIFHGGHMNAGLALGEDTFADDDYSVLVPSRPGYGRTPLSTGKTTGGFADVTRSLCAHLGIDSVAAVVGISAGGPTAMAMAARHPDLVERVVLQSAVGPLPWPDRRTRIGARLAFGSTTERLTWSAVRVLMRAAPDVGLRILLSDLSTRPARQVLTNLSPANREMLLGLFAGMGSGHGFLNDLSEIGKTCGEVTQPALVLASRHDGSVPFTHAEALAATIRDSRLVESAADSHFIWLGEDWPALSTEIRRFLAG
ncbi:alpha/beta hydrolase [Streptomyces sp. WAC 05977]|nr:alpha/beta hydrolase [Streptomyces sp. WAC 05977]